jgi:hypothetical protein
MKRTFRFRARLGLPVVILLAVAITTTSAKAPISVDPTGSAHTKELLRALASAAVVSTPPVDSRLAASAGFVLPWYSFNGGGSVAGTSPNLGLAQAIGESASGRGISPDYHLDYGFLAGAEVCNCPHQGDFDLDGFVTALDLGSLIDIIFAGVPDIQDPDCPTTRPDFNCDGFSDALDIGSYVDYLFAGAKPPCLPCIDL